MKIFITLILVALGVAIYFFIIPMKNDAVLILFSALAGWTACLLVMSIFGQSQLKVHIKQIEKLEKDMEG